jgi:hypothetical protein
MHAPDWSITDSINPRKGQDCDVTDIKTYRSGQGKAHG